MDIVGGQHRSTAVPTQPHTNRVGSKRCADRKKIETKSNRDGIVDRKIELKSIEIDKAES